MTTKLELKSIPLKDQPVPEDGINDLHSVPLWGSCRLVYTVCAFITMFNLILLRFNLSFAMVCMVRDPMTNITDVTTTTTNRTHGVDTSDDIHCPVAPSESHTTDMLGEFEWNKALQGRILSGFFYGYLVSQGFGGWFSDRFGGKLLFILGNSLQSVITLLLPVAARWDPEAMFILRIFQGIVCGLSLPAVFQLYTRWASPTERTALMAVAYTGFPAAHVIIYPYSGVLCGSSLFGGWPAIFYTTGLFGVLCSLVFCFLVYDSADKHPRISEKERRFLNACTLRDSEKPPKIPWKAILISAPVNGFYIAHFCYSWGFITLAVSLPLFMKEVLIFDLKENGLLSALPYLGVLIMRIVIAVAFTPLQRKLGISLTRFRKINHTIGTLGAGMCMLGVTSLTCRDKYLAVALLTLSQAVVDLAFTGGYLLSFLDLAPRLAGMLIGVANTVGSLPGVLAPTLVGLLTPNGTRAEWMLVMYVAAGFYFLGAVSYLLLGSSELQPWATSTLNVNTASLLDQPVAVKPPTISVSGPQPDEHSTDTALLDYRSR